MAESYRQLNDIDTKDLNKTSTDDNDFADLSEKEIVGWKKQIEDVLKSIEKEKHLPENSLVLRSNISRLDNSITSYSVCIYEPDIIEDTKDSARNTIVLRIVENELKSSPEVLRVEPRIAEAFYAIEIPSDAEVHSAEKSKLFFRINQNSNEFSSYISKMVDYSLENYISKADCFACCARYEECSKEKRCIHPNLLFSKACKYRNNLEDDKIFY